MHDTELLTMGCEEIMEIFGLKKSKAYQYINMVRNELIKKGYKVVKGRIPVNYIPDEMK